MKQKASLRITKVSLTFIPVETRIPYQFGTQVLREVTCARVAITGTNSAGEIATGWGETPLSVFWGWPSSLSYDERHQRLCQFCEIIAEDLETFPAEGHPMVIGHRYQQERLNALIQQEAHHWPNSEKIPHLAALICLSAFDLALHDAFGNLHQVPTFDALTEEWLDSNDLSTFFEGDAKFSGKYPSHYLQPRPEKIPVWHAIGGLDAISPDELTGDEPDDGHPVLLRDWIRTDGLDCLKIKLRGNDQRIVDIGTLAVEENVTWLCIDFNCTVTDPAYVNTILDDLLLHHPRIYGMILYVEQPFPYDLKANQIDVHSVSARKPLFMDESAHDWKYLRLGRELGWTGVALKTCKTLTGALLSLCWAREHGMTLMVQDLTNPMLAQIPHALLAAHAGTVMGLESNGMQFYPEASHKERAIHPGLYQRRNGVLDLTTLTGPGFGYGAATPSEES